MAEIAKKSNSGTIMFMKTFNFFNKMNAQDPNAWIQNTMKKYMGDVKQVDLPHTGKMQFTFTGKGWVIWKDDKICALGDVDCDAHWIENFCISMNRPNKGAIGSLLNDYYMMVPNGRKKPMLNRRRFTLDLDRWLSHEKIERLADEEEIDLKISIIKAIT